MLKFSVQHNIVSVLIYKNTVWKGSHKGKSFFKYPKRKQRLGKKEKKESRYFIILMFKCAVYTRTLLGIRMHTSYA